MGKIKDIYAKDRQDRIASIQQRKLIIAIGCILVGALLALIPTGNVSAGVMFIGFGFGVTMGTYTGE
jgi:hypothetical protein